MRIIATEKQIYAGIMGLAVGDALGVPYEFRKRDTFKCEGMTGWGTHNQPPGTWSDDTSLTLATMASIVECGKIDLNDIMRKFSLWYTANEFTAHGETFDCGNITAAAIFRFIVKGVGVHECGGIGEMDNGNGALMRILPLTFVPVSYGEINKITGLTHAHEISKKACRLYLCVAETILRGKPFRPLYTDRCIWGRYFSRVRDIWRLKRDEIKSSGYVVDTLEAALWCLYHTYNYKDCVLAAINLGEDTDTTAAVAGGLAGLLYGVGGEKGIPEEWINQIARKEYIKELCEQLAEVGKNGIEV